MVDGLPAAWLCRTGGCAAQRATAQRPAADSSGAGPGGPAATQLWLHSVVLDGGVVGIAPGQPFSLDGQRQPRATGLAPGRVLLEASQVGAQPAARSAYGRE